MRSVSSRSLRGAAVRGLSPASTLPPGIVQRRLRSGSRTRRACHQGGLQLPAGTSIERVEFGGIGRALLRVRESARRQDQARRPRATRASCAASRHSCRLAGEDDAVAATADDAGQMTGEVGQRNKPVGQLARPELWLGLELRHLVAFDTVSRLGTFSEAAANLGYTQSAVSHQIAALFRRCRPH